MDLVRRRAPLVPSAGVVHAGPGPGADAGPSATRQRTAGRVGYDEQAAALSPRTAQAGPAGQRLGLPKKSVSAVASARLAQARAAIAHVKAVMSAGAGNQIEALLATNMNALARVKVMRDESCWEFVSAGASQLAQQHPVALQAAKADLAHGGNSGEHAAVAFDYLQAYAKGEKLALVATKDLDHAFVMIGDLASDQDADLVVADAWPTAATATLWEDHFAWHADRSQVVAHESRVADGRSARAAIAAGLRLSAKGKALLEAKETAQVTATQTAPDAAEKNRFWSHADSAAVHRKFQYVGPPRR